MCVGSETNTAECIPRSRSSWATERSELSVLRASSSPKIAEAGTPWAMAYARATAASVVRSPGIRPPVARQCHFTTSHPASLHRSSVSVRRFGARLKTFLANVRSASIAAGVSSPM